jgi:hypothetical protein
MHIKEDTSKPENRVNITLFHLLMNERFDIYFKEKLKLPLDSIIYPSSNLIIEEFQSSMRPDFVIKVGDNVIGHIEVELGGENSAQMKNYRNSTGLPVYSIVGKSEFGGDLSLEELYVFIKNLSVPEYSQAGKSFELLSRLILHYCINGNFNDNKRTIISDKMRASNIIRRLYEYFGTEKILENSSCERGKLMIDTVKEGGFSIRVFSINTGSHGLSIMNQRGGRPAIYFPSHAKLIKYLPADEELCNEYSNLILSLGFKEMYHLGESEQARLPLELVEKNLEKFFNIIEKIA